MEVEKQNPLESNARGNGKHRSAEKDTRSKRLMLSDIPTKYRRRKVQHAGKSKRTAEMLRDRRARARLRVRGERLSTL
jgi:hypothetical protein